VAVAVRVDLDEVDVTGLVGGPAIGLAVEVGVLFELRGLVALVLERRVGLAVAVLVVELEARLARAVRDPAVLLAVGVGVLVLTRRRLAVGLEVDPRVGAAVVVGVALGALGDAALVEHDLVEAAVRVRVLVALGDLLVLVVDQLDGRAAALRVSGPGREDRERAARTGEPRASGSASRQRGC
jgi:hypothetical protein